MEPIKKLTFVEKFGFGLGDTASNFVWATITTFLLFYYTDIFGISAAVAGTISLVARCADGGIDFFMGAIADRTETKWGKFRPYLIWMCCPLAVVFVLTFTTPDISMNGKIIYAFVTYILLMLFYTAINIPYGAISGVMTDDPLDRTSLNSYRMALSNVGGIAVNLLTLPLIRYFGDLQDFKQTSDAVANATEHAKAAHGYQMTAIIFGVVSIILFVLTFLATKERIRPPANQKTGLLDDLKMLFNNKHWVLLLIAASTAMTCISIRGGAALYYTQHYAGLGDQLIPIWGSFTLDGSTMFLALGNCGFILGAMSTRFLVKAIGKKLSYIVTFLAISFTCAIYYWLPPTQTSLIFAFQFLNAFTGGLNAAVFFTLIADTADFSEWKYKVRTTGIVFAAITCSQKVGLGIGGFIQGMIFSAYGYDGKAVEISATAQQGILLVFSLIPAAGFFFIACLFTRYGLTEENCATIREELTQRRLDRGD